MDSDWLSWIREKVVLDSEWLSWIQTGCHGFRLVVMDSKWLSWIQTGCLGFRMVVMDSRKGFHGFRMVDMVLSIETGWCYGIISGESGGIRIFSTNLK